MNLKNIFQQQEYIGWRNLRDMPDSQFIGLTLPRFVFAPYRTKPGSYKGLFFYEKQVTMKTQRFGVMLALLLRQCLFVNLAVSAGLDIFRVPRNHVGRGLLTQLPTVGFESDAKNIANRPAKRWS